jgi:hypothetical protein
MDNSWPNGDIGDIGDLDTERKTERKYGRRLAPAPAPPGEPAGPSTTGRAGSSRQPRSVGASEQLAGTTYDELTA